MIEGSNLIDRQAANALIKKCARNGHFDGQTAEPLWVWQGRRRVDIKESLGVEFPTVYGPPRSRRVAGPSDPPDRDQVWRVETEPEVNAELHVRNGSQGRPGGYVLGLWETADSEPQRGFCGAVSGMGLVGLSFALRGSEDPNGVAKLAEVYLGFGRCYAGAAVTDILRVLDHIEQEFSIDAEPIVLVLSGLGIPLGLAAGAIDQRISGLVVDFESAPKSILAPVGQPPFFKEQYLHLGPNPLLVLAQCYAPRPMMVVGDPEGSQMPWLENEKSGVLSFADQLVHLQFAYDSARYAGRFQRFESGPSRPKLPELIGRILEYYQRPNLHK